MRELINGTPAVTRARRVAMLASTAAIPLFFGVMMGLGMFWMQRLSHQHPEITELRDCLITLDISLQKRAAAAKNERERGKIAAQREALEIYVAGYYRDVVGNPQTWNNPLVRSSIPPQLRVRAETLVSRPEPPAEELEQAKTLIQPILEEHQAMQAVTAKLLSPSRMLLIQFAMAWFLFVAIPGCVAVLIFRRGPIMRIFGVEIVGRAGAPATRARLLLRWFLFNLPVLLIPILIAMMYVLPPALVNTLVAAGLVGIAYSSCRLPQRGIADRLSGTYLVPE